MWDFQHYASESSFHMACADHNIPVNVPVMVISWILTGRHALKAQINSSLVRS